MFYLTPRPRTTYDKNEQSSGRSQLSSLAAGTVSLWALTESLQQEHLYSDATRIYIRVPCPVPLGLPGSMQLSMGRHLTNPEASQI